MNRNSVYWSSIGVTQIMIGMVFGIVGDLDTVHRLGPFGDVDDIWYAWIAIGFISMFLTQSAHKIVATLAIAASTMLLIYASTSLFLFALVDDNHYLSVPLVLSICLLCLSILNINVAYHTTIVEGRRIK
jgi:hypothetical protein